MPSEAMSRFAAFPENAVATAQHGLANMCRAWTQVALGMMAAGNAELKAAQSICAVTPSAWQPIVNHESAQAAARLWLRDVEGRCRVAVEAQLQANRELAAALLGASETLLEGLPFRGVAAAGERAAEGARRDAGDAGDAGGDVAPTAGDAGDAGGDVARATGGAGDATVNETKQPRAA